jgi:hypothetical protein
VALAGLLEGAAGCRDRGGPAGAISFDPAVVSLGYPQHVVARIAWRPARALDRIHGKPLVFLHLLRQDKNGKSVVRTFDHPLPDPWLAGRPQAYDVDLFQSALAEPLPPGPHVLSLGLYDDSWGYRWPLQAGGLDVGRREYQVATVDVTGPDPSAPRFSYSGEWMEPEAVPTRQVLARRCLRGPATLSVEDIHAGGTLRMLWTVADARGPATGLTASCDAGWSRTLGAGKTWVSAPIPADAADGRCQLRIDADPNEAWPGQAAACLDVLAWRRDAAR